MTEKMVHLIGYVCRKSMRYCGDFPKLKLKSSFTCKLKWDRGHMEILFKKVP